MKRLFTPIILIFTTILLQAGETGERYSVSVTGLYGWNDSWKHHGGFDISGFLPVSRHFEATAAAEYHNPGTFAVTATARPKFHLGKGDLFIDGSAHFRAHASYGIADFNIAVSAGYRMDYFSIQAGATTHFTFDLERKGKSDTIIEALNLLYKVRFNVRPATSRWNLGGGIANYTDYEYERTWVPMLFIDGHFNVSDSIALLWRFDFKPAGTFHQAAEFWGAAVRVGAKYSF